MKRYCIGTFVTLFTAVTAVTSVEQNDVTQSDSLNYLSPNELQMSDDEVALFSWTASVGRVDGVNVTLDNEGVITLGDHIFTTNETSTTVQFNISAVFIGYSNVTIDVLRGNEVVASRELRVSVILSYQLVNQIYMGVLGVLLFVVFINMGAVFDTTIFRAVAKNPVGPLVGLFSQFVAMPLVAFGLSKLFFPNQPLLQLALFLCGTVPGGGTSNMWTYLIGGNFDLSLIMTTVSSLVAFAAIPAWTVTLGPLIADGTDIVVPVMEIVLLVLGLVIPCTIGFLVQKFIPKLAKVFEQMLTPLILFIFIFSLTYGAYANRFIFKLVTWKIVLAGLTLPTLGYGIGSILAYLFRCSRRDIIAISIETGIQNVTLAVFMLNYSLPQPGSTIAIAVPGCAAIMTPLSVALIGLAVHAYAGNINKKNMKIIFNKIKNCDWYITAESFQDGHEEKKEPSVAKSNVELMSSSDSLEGGSNSIEESTSSEPMSSISTESSGVQNDGFERNEK